MRKVLAVLAALLFFGGLAGATTTTTTLVQDVTSSKNEVLAKGTSPHVRLFDTDGTGNYGVSVDHGVLQFTEEQAGGLFSAPSDAKLGIAYTPPSNVTAVASNTGGSLATGTYYIVVTAHDGGTGETFASNEVTCVITTGSVGKCVVSWDYVPPPAASYRIYVGTAAGVETHYFVGTSPYTLTSTAGTAASPPAANTAFLVYLDNLGLHFADGSSQLTASAGGAWMANGADWISAGAAAKYGISSDGHVFTPDALLEILGTFHATGAITGDSTIVGTRVRGTAMVHEIVKHEEGHNSDVTLTFDTDTTVITTSSVAFSGVHKVRISAAGNGFAGADQAGSDTMKMTVLRDGATTVGAAEVTWQACSTCGTTSAVPWSAHIEIEETPSTASHTYSLHLRCDGTGSVFCFYNAAYLAVDELP